MSNVHGKVLSAALDKTVSFCTDTATTYNDHIQQQMA